MEGFNCTYQSVIVDVPYQIWEAITTDGPSATPYLITRVFHNKPLFYFMNFSRCYFHYLSPLFLSQTLGPYLTLLLIAVSIYLWKRGGTPWKIIKIILLLYPLIFVFELQNKF